MLGSIAGRIVRYAHCPVLITSRDGGLGVLVAMDLSDPSLPALSRGVQEARSRGVPLVALHVVDSASTNFGSGVVAPFGAPAPFATVEFLEQLRSATKSALEAAMTRVGADGSAVVLAGPPAATIVSYAKEIGAGLVMLGTRGKTGLARILLGSVAETVVADAECSVLAVRLADTAA